MHCLLDCRKEATVNAPANRKLSRKNRNNTAALYPRLAGDDGREGDSYSIKKEILNLGSHFPQPGSPALGH